MLSSQFHTLEAELSIRICLPTSSLLNIVKLMIPIQDAVFQVAHPILVLILSSSLLLVFTAIPKLDSSTIPTTEHAHASQDSILRQLRPSSAMPAQLFTAQSATH